MGYTDGSVFTCKTDCSVRTSCRTRIVIIFQQQLVFHIETKGSGTSSDPLITRRDKHACGKPMLTEKTEFLSACSPSQKISRSWRLMCPHILVKRELRFRRFLQKWSKMKNQGNTVLKLIFQKIEIEAYS